MFNFRISSLKQFFVFGFLIISSPVVLGATFISAGSGWAYLDDGSDPGTAWQGLGFDDSLWSTGPAQLGYGDGDEATVVSFGPDANNKFITTYFRQSFTIVDPAQVLDLTLNLLRDDGAVVYLNGTEVARSNMPVGAITSTTLAATGTAGADESTFFTFSVDPALLVSGSNLIAVEVHQNGGASSDLSFDLSLSGNEIPVGDTQAPTTPTDLAGLAVGSDQIDLSWTASSDLGGGSVAGYNVYRDGGTTPIATVTGTGYSDTGLTANTAYSYTVTAFDTAVPANESLPTVAAVVSTGTVDTQAPTVPGGVTATAVSDSQIDLGWTASTDLGGGVVAGYNIYRDGGTTPITTVTGTSYSDTGLTANTLYSYSVTAFDNALPANESASADSAATTLSAPPVTATFISAGSGWAYLDDGSDPGTAWQGLGFDDSLWSTGPAQLGYGDGDEATVVSFGPDANNKFITTYFRQSFTIVDPTQVLDLTLNLLRDDGAVVYLNGTEVARSNMPVGAITSTTLAATGTAGADESTFFTFSVDPALLVSGSNLIAVEVHQNGGASSDLSFDLSLSGNEIPVGDTQAPTTPTDLAGLAVGSSQIDLSWTASSDLGGGSVAGYNVYRDGGTTPIATVTGTGYSDTGLTANTAYSYTVTAFDTAVPANESLPTVAAVVSTGTVDTQAPTVPGGVTATAVSDSQIDLGWTASTDLGGGVVAGYNIYRDGGTTPITTVTGTSYSDTGLTANTLYSYSVTAFDNALPANESASADASATTLSAPVTATFIAAGSGWAYLDDGSDPGTAWQGLGFDDSLWSTGPAQLGYGDGDEATLVSFGPDANNKHITTYFRQGFTIADPTQVLDLTLNLLRDDGAVVYLNGIEVARSNMPVGVITSTTLAADAIGGTDESTLFTFSVDPALLVSGNNVIAVEVHQGDIGSSDLSFDLSLSGTEIPIVDTQAPTTPTDLAGLAVGSDQIDLSWTASSDLGGGSVAGYNVYRDGGTTPIATVTGTSYSDTGLTANTAYSYTVTAFDTAVPANESLPTVAAVVSTGTVDTQAPTVPGGVTATAVSDSQIDLGWTASTDLGGGVVAGYNIYRDGGTTPITTVTGTSYSDTGLTANTLYSYSVTAFDNALPANESASADASATTLSAPVTATFIAAGSGWAYLDDGSDPGTAWQGLGFDDSLWSTGPAQLGYGDGDEATLVSFGPDANNKHITTYFRQGFTIADPTQVLDLTLNLLRDDGAVVYLNGIEVARSNMPVGVITSTTLAADAIGGTDESTLFTFSVDPALLVSGNNVIAVEVHQGDIGSSDLSFDLSLSGTEIPIVDTQAPTTPTDLAGLAVGSSQIDLSWTASSDLGGGSVAGYNVYRDGGTTPIATVTGTSYSDTGLTANTAYSYTVTAFDTAVPANESLPTVAAVVSTGTVDTQAPTVPGGVTATAVSDSQIDLGWTASTDLGGGVVAGYNIYRDGGTTPITTVTGTSYSDTGLTANTLYSYSVTAFDNALPANESASADASATTLSAPVTATFIAAGSGWAYLDDGSDPGTAWQGLGFDDSLWSTGPAQLGYGDGDEATLVSFGPDANNKHITTYFRQGFTIADPTQVLDLTLNLLRDDGAVVYLNGIEVARSNMPVGVITSTTLAADAIGGTDESTLFTFSVDPALLVSGNNVIAVEVHQGDIGSSDLSFDLSLSGTEIPIVDTQAPTTPTDLAGLAVGSSQIDLSWTASSDLGGGSVAGYNVYRDSGTTPIATVTGTSYSDTGLTANTAYSYTVTAFDTAVPANESLPTVAAVVSTGTVDTQAPTVPGGVTATAVSDSQIDLGWTASTDLGGGVVAGYNIYRDGGTTPITTVTGTSYSDTGLTANTLYSYSVTAFDNALPANESASADASATTLSAPVTATFIAAGSGWAYLDDGSDPGTAWQGLGFDDSLWSTGPAQLGYGDGDEATLVSFGPDANNKHITTYFRQGFTIVDPTQVLDLTLNLLRDDGAVVYLNGIEVARSNMPVGVITSTTLAADAIGGTDESTLFTFSVDPALLVSGNNVIAVEVHQGDIGSSDLSFDLSLSGTEIPIVDTQAPTTPTDLAGLAVGSDQIDLSWTASSDLGGGSVAGYNVYRDGGTTPIATVTGTGYSDTGLTANTAYSYTVTAFDTAVPANESLPTVAAVVSTGTVDTQAPTVPGGVTATAVSDSQIDLGWTASTDLGGGVVAGYNIYRDGGVTPIATVTGTSYSDTGLTANTLYSYSVTAFDNALPANESASADASATTLSAPVTATFIAAGSGWAYLDDGSDPGTAWQGLGFDDSLWSTGPAQLGYGDGDEATVVSFGPNAANKFITTYFRQSFTIVDPARVLDLMLNLLRDDGAVVYLNGIEVARSNMPVGVITSTTLAADAIGGTDESTFFTFSLDPALLVSGNNVIAVEVHQGDIGSSDLSFDLSLSGTEIPTPDLEAPTTPTDLAGLAVGSSQIDLSWTASSDLGGGSVAGYNVYRDSGATPIATVTGTGYSDTGLTANTAYSYTVTAFDTAVPANESLPTVAAVVSTGTVDTQAPTVPGGVTATAVSDSQIDLGWTASTDLGGGVVAGYNIYRDGGTTPITTVTGTSYSDTGLTANTLYSYSVTAFDNALPVNESASADASAATLSAPVTATFIAAGSGWAYLDDGSDPGTAWQGLGFDDSLWSTGPAQLGYGDGDEATVVSFGPNAANKFITTYFRQSFTIVDPARVLDLTLNLLRDDGAVVYLNGIEVARSNMPVGVITSTTLAADAIGGTDESTFFTFSVDPALLVSGNNVIAVEVHQGDIGSSDLSFDLSLSGTEIPTPDLEAPTTPMGFGGVGVGIDQIDLSWTASSDMGGGSVAGYNVYRDSGATPIATVTGTGYSDTGLTANTAYSYTVTAFDTAVPANESLPTVAAVVSTGSVDDVAPEVPGGVTATAVSDSQIDLGWTASTDLGGGVVAGYNIYRDGGVTPIATVTGTSYSDTGLTANTLYSYSVTAFDNALPVNESASAEISSDTFTTPAAINLIKQGDDWNYLDNGSDPGTAWQGLGFDDSLWSTGPAELGYGDNGDEATVVGFGPEPNNKYITTYFRQSFTIVDPARVLDLTLNLLRDDGAVVYLNGTEVARSNMPAGTITSTTLATSDISGADESTFIAFSVDPALLVSGTNVLAVEVHQSAANSSDLSFDLNLTGNFTPGFTNGYLPISEDFDAGFTRTWQEVDEAGDPSNWGIVGDQYQQQNLVRVSGQNLIDSYHLGSFSYLDEGFTLTDYRLSLAMTPLGSTGDNIGVMFRYQDQNNYYRLSMDSRFGFTRLEKRVDGAFTTLARNARGYVLGQTVNIDIEVVGQAILVTMDDVPLFSATDSSLANGTIALYASSESEFDNVIVDQVSADPGIIISTPAAYSVETTGTLNVLAIANAVPSGGQVDFLLDGVFITNVDTPPYMTTLNSVSQGRHAVTVNLYDDGNLVDTDTKTVVGVSGDYHITIGDSIFNGTGDLFSSDGQSADGRIIGFSGYQPVLSDLLNPPQNPPPSTPEGWGKQRIFFNEAVGGDDSFDATTRINSILERHPEANRAEIMLGTNDSGGMMPVISTVYEANMNTLLGALPTGMDVTIAIPPPVFGTDSSSVPYDDPLATGTRNDFIKAYRTVIKTSLTAPANVNIGPDFFKCFIEDANFFSLFGDNLHLNGLGNDVVGHLWHAILTGAMSPTSPDPCIIPRLVLHNLDRSTVDPYLKQNLIEVGDKVYVDETFTLSALPSGLGLETGVWVMTANAESGDTRNPLPPDNDPALTFGVGRDVTVYIAYDIDTTAGSGETLPDWISSSYSDTTEEISLSGVARPLRLYSAVFTGGTELSPLTIELGGNQADGAFGALNNYLVIVIEN